MVCVWVDVPPMRPCLESGPFLKMLGRGRGRGDSERLLIIEKRDFRNDQKYIFSFRADNAEKGRRKWGFPHTYSRTALKCEYWVLFYNTCAVCR